MQSIKIGQGFDLHRLVSGRRLLLGGVEIPSELGLLGHSDADVLIHAIIDALIGATIGGDIGCFFPDTDVQYKDMNSREMLRTIRRMINEQVNYSINNIDSTIIIQTPKLREYIAQMKLNIAEDLSINSNLVNIKAKTSEGIGIVGRNEAVIAQVTLLVTLNI